MPTAPAAPDSRAHRVIPSTGPGLWTGPLLARVDRFDPTAVLRDALEQAADLFRLPSLDAATTGLRSTTGGLIALERDPFPALHGPAAPTPQQQTDRWVAALSADLLDWEQVDLERGLTVATDRLAYAESNRSRLAPILWRSWTPLLEPRATFLTCYVGFLRITVARPLAP